MPCPARGRVLDAKDNARVHRAGTIRRLPLQDLSYRTVGTPKLCNHDRTTPRPGPTLSAMPAARVVSETAFPLWCGWPAMKRRATGTGWVLLGSWIAGLALLAETSSGVGEGF